MKAKEEWRRLIRTKKTQAFQRFVEQTDKNNCWEALRRLEGKRKRTEITRLKTGEQYRTDPEQIAAALAKHYFPEEEADRTQEDPQSPRIHVTQGTTKTSGNNKPKPTEQFTSKTQITFELARRRAKTTPGHDEIPFMVLRQNADKLAGPLAKLYNAIAKIGYYPTSWRKGIVCNIQKPGKSGEEPSHFRPITLLPTMSKVLETLLAHRISQWAEALKLLPECQHGFRKGRSTRRPLWQVTHDIWKTLNSRKRMVGISLDLSSAYDRVHTPTLEKKLQDMQLPLEIHQTLKSYLNQRSNIIEIQNKRFEFTPSQGLPQGSPISPILYDLYAADLPKYIESTVSVQMYADDVLLYKEIGKEEDIREVQKALIGIERWCSQNRMKLDWSKTQSVIFQRNKDQTEIPLTLQQRPLQYSEEMKYLGIIFDRQMRFKKHINQKMTEAVRRLNSIRKMARAL